MGTVLMCLLGMAAVMVGVVPILLTLRLERFITRVTKNPPVRYTPCASVIVPCKGADEHFARNIESMMTQDYPSYELIFAVESMDDPAYSVLRTVIAAHPAIPARVVVSSRSNARSQKMTNVLTALEYLDYRSLVVVFIDSDVRLHSRYVRDLIAPLASCEIGATTGLHFYLPIHGNIGALTRSCWACGALPILADPKRNFTHGGTVALKRMTLIRTHLKEKLSKTICDSFTITHAIRQAGLEIQFVPTCLAVARETGSFLATLHWTNRQTMFSRVYNPKFWRMVCVTYCASTLLVLVGMVLAYASALGYWHMAIPAILMLSIIPCEMVHAALLLRMLLRLLPRHRILLRTMAWKYVVVAPLTHVVITINSLVSLFKKRFIWSGIQYTITAPECYSMERIVAQSVDTANAPSVAVSHTDVPVEVRYA